MSINENIRNYIASHPEPKRSDMQELHDSVLRIKPDCKLWFLDGRNDQGKVVTNPNIGYGVQTMRYADNTSREFYRVGLSANTSGISVYIMGLDDKKYFADTYGKDIGKATVTGYCIRFKALKDVNISVLEAAIRNAVEDRTPPLTT